MRHDTVIFVTQCCIVATAGTVCHVDSLDATQSSNSCVSQLQLPYLRTADSVLLLAACQSFCYAQLNQDIYILVCDTYCGYASKYAYRHTKVELLGSCVRMNTYQVVVDSSRAPEIVCHVSIG